MSAQVKITKSLTNSAFSYRIAIISTSFYNHTKDIVPILISRSEATALRSAIAILQGNIPFIHKENYRLEPTSDSLSMPSKPPFTSYIKAGPHPIAVAPPCRS